MNRVYTFCLLLLVSSLILPCAFGSELSGPPGRILIVYDELPQMEVLQAILQKKGGLEVTLVEQSALPDDWSAYKTIIGYIHRGLEVPTEKAIIAYTENGGRYIALHHSISSKKASNEFYFDFLGMRLDNPKSAKHPVLPGAGYGWREGVTLTLVNLYPDHYITSHNVDWGEKIPYTSSDKPAEEAMYASMSLHESEAYMNHKFTDGRAKTVLCGFKFFDDRNGQMFMQDRAVWLKKYGEGEVVYLMPGHSAHDFENVNFSQMILNAINWES
jgi:hypothetical protein